MVYAANEKITSEDYNTLMKIAHVSDKFLCLPECLGFYDGHDENNIPSRDMALLMQVVCEEFVHLMSPEESRKYQAL